MKLIDAETLCDVLKTTYPNANETKMTVQQLIDLLEELPAVREDKENV